MISYKVCNDIYFDNAATTRFKPKRAVLAMARAFYRSANAGRSGHAQSLNSGLIIEDLRDQIKRLTFDGNVILTKNCTESLNLAIFGCKPKGEVITSVFEHNSVLRPLHYLEKQNKIKVKYVKPASNVVTVNELSKLITYETKLIVLSEMSNVTGAVHEIEKIAEIAKQKGIKVIIDGAQSLGHTKTDYQNVDIICASGHKGLHGPQGTGFLCVKEGIMLNPLLFGGTGTMGISLDQPQMMPEGLESGTANTPGAAALFEGIRWTLKNMSRINKKIQRLSQSLIEGLRNIKGISLYSDNTNGVISFNVANKDSTEVADILSSKYSIAVRSGIHCAPLAHRHLGTIKNGAVRASIGFNNNMSDVQKLCDALADIIK